MSEVIFKQEKCIEELKKDEYVRKKLEEMKVLEPKESSIDDLLK